MPFQQVLLTQLMVKGNVRGESGRNRPFFTREAILFAHESTLGF